MASDEHIQKGVLGECHVDMLSGVTYLILKNLFGTREVVV